MGLVASSFVRSSVPTPAYPSSQFAYILQAPGMLPQHAMGGMNVMSHQQYPYPVQSAVFVPQASGPISTFPDTAGFNGSASPAAVPYGSPVLAQSPQPYRRYSPSAGVAERYAGQQQIPGLLTRQTTLVS